MVPLCKAVTVALGLAWAVVACGPEPAPPPAETPAAAPAKPQAATPVAKPATEATAPEEVRFVYDPTGLRDPFAPFVRLEDSKTKTVKKVFVPKTPLQRYSTEELLLVGVVWAEGGASSALIEDPERKGYVAGKGTLVGDRGGKIVRIEPGRVTIEERFVDLFGEENVNVVTMTLRRPEGEVSP